METSFDTCPLIFPDLANKSRLMHHPLYARQRIDRTARKGWTPWAKGQGESDIERVWWAARVLHFAKLNVSCWFDGSELVAIEHWGYRGEKWPMKLKPAGWVPLPEVYRLARERAQQEALERWRTEVRERNLERLNRLAEKRAEALGLRPV